MADSSSWWKVEMAGVLLAGRFGWKISTSRNIVIYLVTRQWQSLHRHHRLFITFPVTFPFAHDLLRISRLEASVGQKFGGGPRQGQALFDAERGTFWLFQRGWQPPCDYVLHMFVCCSHLLLFDAGVFAKGVPCYCTFSGSWFMTYCIRYLPHICWSQSGRTSDKSDPFLSMFIFHCMFAVSLSGQIRRVAIPIPWNDKREKPRWQLKWNETSARSWLDIFTTLQTLEQQRPRLVFRLQFWLRQSRWYWEYTIRMNGITSPLFACSVSCFWVLWPFDLSLHPRTFASPDQWSREVVSSSASAREQWSFRAFRSFPCTV